MSTTESIASSQTSLSSWRKSDTTWTLGLFGTAIGAGVLFFPIRAGFGGLIPILVMLVLAYPIAFIAIGRWPGYACRGLTLRQYHRNGGRAFWQNRRGGDHLSVLLRHLPTAVDLWRHDHQYLYDFLGEPAADAGSQPRGGGAAPAAADGVCHLVW